MQADRSDEMTIRERFMATIEAEGAISPGLRAARHVRLLESMAIGFDVHTAMRVEL